MVQTAKRHASARMEVNVRAHLAPVPVFLASLERTAVKVSVICAWSFSWRLCVVYVGFELEAVLLPHPVLMGKIG